MKKLYMLSLFVVMLVLSGAGCDIDEIKELNTSTNRDAAKESYAIIKNTDIDNESGVETAKNVVDSIQGVTAIVTRTVPGAAPIAGPLGFGLSALSTILGLFFLREKKKVKVHETRADDYSAAIEAGLNAGEDADVLDKEALRVVLDSDTKAHFNATGTARL